MKYVIKSITRVKAFMNKTALFKISLALLMFCISSAAFPLKVSIHPDIIVTPDHGAYPPPPPQPLPPPPPGPYYHHEHQHWDNWDNRYPHHGARHRPYNWATWMIGTPIPAHAIIGNDLGERPYYVCQAYYAGGIHPGKYLSDGCNIGYGGQEVVLQDFRILTGRDYSWVPARFGQIPDGAVVGGHDANGQGLYVCRGEYQGEKHPGKIVGQNCNFGWGGQEITTPYYEVLVY
jgi:hypothetical protein